MICSVWAARPANDDELSTKGRWMTSFCGHCGSPTRADNRHCGQCGRLLVDGPARSDQTVVRSSLPVSEQTLIRTSLPPLGGPATPSFDPPSAPPPPGESGLGQDIRRRKVWLISLAAGLLLAAVVLGVFLLARRAPGSADLTATAPATVFRTVVAPVTGPVPPPNPGPTPSAVTPAPTIVAPTSVTSPSDDLDAAARVALEERRRESLLGFSPRGQWIVQLASKWHGIQDPNQVAASGTNTFTVQDILAEHEALRDKFGGSIRLLASTDLGKQSTYPGKPAGEVLWVTIFDPGSFGSKDAATVWCTRQFPSLSADALKNVCYPKQATAPHL